MWYHKVTEENRKKRGKKEKKKKEKKGEIKMTKTKKFTWNGLLNGKKGIMPVAMAAIMTMSGAAAMTNFAASSAIPASAAVITPTNVVYAPDGEVEGNIELLDYLKTITPGNKSKLLVQQGESIKLDTSEAKPKIEEDGADLLITTRRVEKFEDANSDLSILDGTIGSIYPGAVVRADKNLADGCPNTLPIEGKNRRPLSLYLDLAGNTLEAQSVSDVSVGTVNPKINEMLKEWFKGDNTAAAKVNYKCIMVHSEKQLDMALGVKGAANKYGVDVKACMKGDKQQMLVIFNQVYYTVRTDPKTADGLFNNNVSVEDFKKHNVNAENPGLAEVTSMSYGRQIAVLLETDNKSAAVETAWNASVSATEIKAEGKYKEIMENTKYSICAYGGNSDTVGELMESRTLGEVNKALKADLQFSAKTPAVPLSYCTNFLDDATKATVNRTTDYVSTTYQVRKPITFEVDSASLWCEKYQHLYGRKITGIDDNGKLILGNWEEIDNNKGDVKRNDIPGSYAEFGFEVDVRGGTDWPYSNVFWRANNGVVNNIKIETGGTCRMANVKISVNGNEVFNKKNCDSHSRYNWGI